MALLLSLLAVLPLIFLSLQEVVLEAEVMMVEVEAVGEVVLEV
tara:strand:- start:399 stop:527 length:129 start_codon:yes stop_codon:yes gene_type:complete